MHLGIDNDNNIWYNMNWDGTYAVVSSIITMKTPRWYDEILSRGFVVSDILNLPINGCYAESSEILVGGLEVITAKESSVC